MKSQCVVSLQMHYLYVFMGDISLSDNQDITNNLILGKSLHLTCINYLFFRQRSCTPK